MTQPNQKMSPQDQKYQPDVRADKYQDKDKENQTRDDNKNDPTKGPNAQKSSQQY